MDRFQLEIITPKRMAYADMAQEVYVPTANGRVGVLAHHVPLFTVLAEGEIRIVSGAKEYFLAIGGGYMQVSGEGVSILVSRVVHAEEINEAEIKKAIQAAQEAIHRHARGEELRAAHAVLRRSFVELTVLKHRRRRRHEAPPQEI